MCNGEAVYVGSQRMCRYTCVLHLCCGKFRMQFLKQWLLNIRGLSRFLDMALVKPKLGLKAFNQQVFQLLANALVVPILRLLLR